MQSSRYISARVHLSTSCSSDASTRPHISSPPKKIPLPLDDGCHWETIQKWFLGPYESQTAPPSVRSFAQLTNVSNGHTHRDRQTDHARFVATGHILRYAQGCGLIIHTGRCIQENISTVRRRVRCDGCHGGSLIQVCLLASLVD